MDDPPTARMRSGAILDQLVSLVFFVLVGASLLHLAAEHTAQCCYTFALCLLIAAGYWSGLALSGRLRAPGRVAWLAALVALWLVLVSISPGALPYAYLWCAIPLACLAVRTLGERTALAATVVIGGAPVLVLLRLDHQLGPDGIAAPIVAVWATVGLFQLQRREALTRQRLLEELQDVQDQLTERQREAGALAERARIARDLHDTLAQELSGSRMLLQAAERDRRGDPDRAWRHVHAVSQALGEHLEHAEARNVLVSLSAQPDQTVLLVCGDGTGFSPTRIRPEHGRGFGLPALRERMRSCGGSLVLESSPGHGTGITATLPNSLPAEREARSQTRGGLAAVAS